MNATEFESFIAESVLTGLDNTEVVHNEKLSRKVIETTVRQVLLSLSCMDKPEAEKLIKKI